MSLREAAQQALEALQTFNAPDSVFHGEFDDEITALRTALAEPEKPCPYIRGSSEGTHWCALAAQRAEPEQEFVCSTGLCRYRKPLTDEEIVDLWAGVSMDYDDQINIIEMARAIEHAHGIGGEA
jgi:hypothetical protein